MAVHIVKQGEHLSRIAASYGLTDYNTIWNHPNNAELKNDRQNPNVLYPGDQVFIPDKQTKEDFGATENRHRFKYHSKVPKLRIVVKDAEGQPITDAKCNLIIETDSFEMTTDTQGMIEKRIKPTDENGKLIIQDLGMEVTIKIGHLDPMDEVSGYKARLNNLGYDAGPLEEDDELRLRSAVEEFQLDHGLKVDGIIGPKTQAKLKDVHGC